jgi:hypothetical protein
MVCFVRLFVESSREFDVHDRGQERDASLALLAAPIHARVPIAENFVDSRMPSPAHRLKWGCCVPFLRYHDHKQFAGIGIGIVGKSCLCGRFSTNLVGYKIGRGVVRGSRVVRRVVRVCFATLLDVKSDVRIACQCRYREICQVSSWMQNIRFGWSNKQQTRIKWFGPNQCLFHWSGAEIWSCVRKWKSGIMAVFTV